MSRELAIIRNTLGPRPPALITHAGEQAAWRFLEFFTVNIRNPNTCAAYKQAATSFLSWCQGNGITRIENVLPVHVAAYIEESEGFGRLRPSNSTSPASACFSTGW